MNTNHIVSISLSSADSLAGQSPYEFRPIVIGHQASPAIAALIEHFGIKTLIVVHTNDAFGNGEAQEVEALFKNATTGANVNDIPYALGQTDYGSVVAQISQTLSTDGVSPTTGIFIAMDQSDGQSILTHALSYPNLAQVQWFGDQEGSSTAFLPPNVPLQVAQFRAKTNTTGIYPVDLSSPITSQFYSEYAAASGGKAIVGYGPNWYDATLIGLQASYMCITSNNYTGDCIANAVRYVSNHYIGATGPKFLDSKGDQLFTFVANWQVVNTNSGNVTIKFVTVYNPQSNSIVPYQGFYAPGY
jgi:ABC-type branched-subunit amino acid transport system substrate-binding protein